MPVTNSYVPLYNPQGGFASFLIPAVMMLIIQQLLCLSLGTSIGTWRESNRGIGVPIDDQMFRNPLAVIAVLSLIHI